MHCNGLIVHILYIVYTLQLPHPVELKNSIGLFTCRYISFIFTLETRSELSEAVFSRRQAHSDTANMLMLSKRDVDCAHYLHLAC